MTDNIIKFKKPSKVDDEDDFIIDEEPIIDLQIHETSKGTIEVFMSLSEEHDDLELFQALMATAMDFGKQNGFLHFPEEDDTDDKETLH